MFGLVLFSTSPFGSNPGNVVAPPDIGWVDICVTEADWSVLEKNINSSQKCN